jgi:DNA helicase-2/ATP-dependent DNA helicase PcrA
VNKLLQNLNPEQKQAAIHTDGPLLILAGAGSGKTTVLVSRTGHLIESGAVKASQILVLTFTNKAARELKERVVYKLGQGAKGIWAGTFHSFGLQVIRENHEAFDLPKYFGLMDASDSRQVLRDLMKTTHMSEKTGFDIDHLYELIGRLRSKLELPVDCDEFYADMARALAPKYERKLKNMSAVDFESLLLLPVELFEKHPDRLEIYQDRYQRIMVDEFQDTNAQQMKLLDALSRKHKNLAVVGDDDQSIYGWRGAEVKNILDFPKRYKPCTVVRLERNYRSHPAILEIANQVIKKNEQRHDKVLRAEKKS